MKILLPFILVTVSRPMRSTAERHAVGPI